MELKEFKNVTAIELSLENCEVLTVKEKDIIMLNFEDIRKDFQVCGDERLDYIRENLIANKIQMAFEPDTVCPSNLGGDNGLVSLKERLEQCADIVSICLITENKVKVNGHEETVEHKSPEIYVNWDYADEYTNSYQMTNVIENSFRRGGKECLYVKIENHHKNEMLYDMAIEQRIEELEKEIRMLKNGY